MAHLHFKTWMIYRRFADINVTHGFVEKHSMVISTLTKLQE